MIAIYTPYPSNRTKYILDYIFEQQFGCGYTLLDLTEINNSTSNIRINYSYEKIEGCFQILPIGLLEAKGIEQIKPDFKMLSTCPILFANECVLGFDIFSAIFYCLSRYEEYQATELDEHQRFSYKQSILFQNNYLHLPLVDLWINHLHAHLDALYPGVLTVRAVEKKIQPTIDIDSVFTYQGKGLKRQLGGFIRDFTKLKWTAIAKRLGVVIVGRQDPFNNFEYQLNQLNQAGLKANYFVQVGPYGAFDKNISPQNLAFQAILKRLVAEGHSVGLHPSYASFLNPKMIAKEKIILEAIIERPIVKSRQHYLRFSLPQTYNDLVSIGIRQEHSMGYSEVPGFRAATSKPFYWYNLNTEESTPLELIPFCAMDVAFNTFKKWTPLETIDSTFAMRNVIREVSGCFCFVFHNESLSDYEFWKGWRTVFENWLKP